MSGAPVELRREPPDTPAAGELFEEYMALVSERLGVPIGVREDIFATPEAFTGPGNAWLVLYEGGRAAGCGGLRTLEPGVCEIKRMFVTERARGRGHGRRLLDELERLAGEAGHRRIRLITTTVLSEALALYEANGYRVIDNPQEGERRDYVMEKRLA